MILTIGSKKKKTLLKTEETLRRIYVHKNFCKIISCDLIQLKILLNFEVNLTQFFMCHNFIHIESMVQD